MSLTNSTVTEKSPFSDQKLNDFRHRGDPLADEVIEAFAAQYGSSIQELAEKLENMIRMPHKDKIIEDIMEYFPDDKSIRDALEKYFIQAVSLPDWVDAEKLELGANVFQDHMFSCVMVLACASLPITYVCQPDTKVLGYTRRLIDDAPKRLIETAQMVVDVMGDGGLSIQGNSLTGKGVRSILKIRLIHASVRYMMLHKEKILAEHQHDNDIDPDNFLLAYVFDSVQEQCKWPEDKKPNRWEIKKDGIPINNEALAIILLTFSYTILRGLKAIGVKLNQQQQDAYLHSWNIVGYVLGLDEEFLQEFSSYAKTEIIYEQILLRRRGHSEDGVLLQRALLKAFSENAHRLIFAARLLHVDRVARLITSKLISKKSYATLGLKLSVYDHVVRFFVWTGVRVFGWFVNIGFLRWLADFLFKRIAKSLWDWRDDDGKQKHKKTGKCAPLIIPHKLVATSHLAGKYNDKTTA